MNDNFKKNTLNNKNKSSNYLFEKISKDINKELLNSNISVSDISFYTALEEEKVKNILDNKGKDFLEYRDVYTAVKVLKYRHRTNGNK